MGKVNKHFIVKLDGYEKSPYIYKSKNEINYGDRVITEFDEKGYCIGTIDCSSHTMYLLKLKYYDVEIKKVQSDVMVNMGITPKPIIEQLNEVFEQCPIRTK